MGYEHRSLKLTLKKILKKFVKNLFFDFTGINFVNTTVDENGQPETTAKR